MLSWRLSGTAIKHTGTCLERLLHEDEQHLPDNTSLTGLLKHDTTGLLVSLKTEHC
jgi:hypothetical protein